MDYAKWALARVDELERRVNQLCDGKVQDVVDSFEFCSENQNQYVSGVREKKIDFPSFCPVKNQNLTIVATLGFAYDFNMNCKFSLVANGEKVKSQNISAAPKVEQQFVAVKKIKCYNEDEMTVSILIESDEDINLSVLSCSLNVVGQIKKTQENDDYGRFSADFYDPNAQDFAEAENEDALEELFGARENCYGAHANVFVYDENNLNEEIDLPEEENQNGAQLSPSERVVGKGQKFALACSEGGDIFFCERKEGENLDSLVGEKLCRGGRVAVAYDKFGKAFVARETLDKKVYVANKDFPSNELFVCDNATDFDIVRAPTDSEYALVVLFAKQGGLFARFINSNMTISAALPLCDESVNLVRAVRGVGNVVLFITSGKQNEIFALKPNPASQEKGYGAAVSVLVY